MALRQVRRRALAAILVVVVSGCAATFARSVGQAEKPPLTAAAAAQAKKHVEAAIAFEERALTAIEERRFHAARNELAEARTQLGEGLATLSEFDAGAASADLEGAESHDVAARTALSPVLAELHVKRTRRKRQPT